MVFDSYLLPELSTLADEPELQSEEKRDLSFEEAHKGGGVTVGTSSNMAYRVNPYNNELGNDCQREGQGGTPQKGASVNWCSLVWSCPTANSANWW